MFSGLNLTIEGEKSSRLSERSGCGRDQTKLIERFYDPTRGIITDGINIQARIDKLRANIGIVSQEPLLFGFHRRQHHYPPQAISGAKASMNEIVAAAEAASAHDFIMSFPNGYDTMVGGKNSKLSGGQKQRIAIATLQGPEKSVNFDLDEARPRWTRKTNASCKMRSIA